MKKDIKITYHPIFDKAIEQAKWLSIHSRRGYYCDKPQSHLSHLILEGGKCNSGFAANIWYGSNRIDVYDKSILPLMKEFAEKFGYTNIELYEG